MVFSSMGASIPLREAAFWSDVTVLGQGEGLLGVCGARSPYVRDDGQEGGAAPCSSEKAAVSQRKTCPEKMFSLAPVWPEFKEASKRAHACAPCHSFPAVFQMEAGSSSTADEGSTTICISSPLPVFF